MLFCKACICKYNIPDNDYLSWPSIHHRWGKDCNNGSIWIQDALLQHSSVLLHSPRQWHIIVLSPTSQWVEQQHRPTVATLDETFVGVLHQKSVTVVDWVAELKGKNGIWIERKEKEGLLNWTSVEDKQEATMYPEIIKQLTAQPLKPHTGVNHLKTFGLLTSLLCLPYIFPKV